MKKINFKKSLLALLVAVSLCFTVFLMSSCSDDGDSELDAFAEAMSATNPTQITGTVKLSAEYGVMNATYNAAIAEDGSFTLNYSYDKFNDLSTGGADDVSSKVEGTVTYENGEFSDSSIASNIPASAVVIKLDLDADDLDAKVSANGSVLTVVVKAADTEATLGVAYEADVTLVLTKIDGKIASLAASYTLSDYSVEVVCVYK